MTKEKATHLFLGGPWDGRRVCVAPDAPIIAVHPVEDAGFGMLDAKSEHGDTPDPRVMYRRAKLRAPGREWIVFAADDMADGDVIGRLIEGYGVATE